MTKLEEMMIKASASLAESKSIVEVNNLTKDEEIRKHYTDRYNACMEIRDSVLNFFKANWEFLRDISTNKKDWRTENVYDFLVGKELNLYKDYDAEYDFKVTVDTATNEVTNVRLDKLDKIYQQKFDCGQYPSHGNFYGFKEEVDRLSHKDDYTLARFEERMKNEEKYWNNIFLPMFEIYLTNVKERQLRKNRLLEETIGKEKNSSKIVCKVTIEIEEISTPQN